MALPREVDLLGLPIHAIPPEDLINYLITKSEGHEGGYIATVNLDGLRLTRKNGELRDQVLGAAVRVADGKPLVWASRLQGTPLPARVAGSDLIVSLSRALAEGRRSLFLLGGNPGTAEKTGTILQELAPGLRLCGVHSPPVGFLDDVAEMNAVRSILEATRPDFIYVGLPFDVALRVAVEVGELLPKSWCLGLGVSFSFVSGEIARAPRWMQEAGLEWLHRLVKEPRRLARRYLVYGLPFVGRLMLAALAVRCQRGSRSAAV